MFMKSKFTYLNYAENTQIIYLKRYSESFPVSVKIQPYLNEDDALNNMPNNDSLFSYLLSQLILQKKTTHILLPIINFDVDYDKIQLLLKTTPIYDKINEKIEFGEISNLFSIRIREYFFKSQK